MLYYTQEIVTVKFADAIGIRSAVVCCIGGIALARAGSSQQPVGALLGTGAPGVSEQAAQRDEAVLAKAPPRRVALPA